MELDVGSMVVGKQVFNLLNRVYQQGENTGGLWFVYTNYVVMKTVNGEGIIRGMNQELRNDDFQGNNYRVSNRWVTGQLRTYLFDLYVQIPMVYFMEEVAGAYYAQAHDKFIAFALVEIAGQAHTKFVNQYLYLEYAPEKEIFPCYDSLVEYYTAQSRILKPFKKSKSLSA